MSLLPYDAAVAARLPRGGVEEQKEEPIFIPLSRSATSPRRKRQSMSSPQHDRRNPSSSDCQGNSHQSQCNIKPNLKESFESFTKAVIGSCGTVVQTATYMVQGQCRWPGEPAGFQRAVSRTNGTPHHIQQSSHPRPPLSIAEEIRKMNQHMTSPAPYPAAGARFFQSSPMVGPGYGTPPPVYGTAAPSGAIAIDPMTGRPITTDVPKFLGEEAVQSFEDDDNVSALSQHTLEEMAISESGGRRRPSPREQLHLLQQKLKYQRVQRISAPVKITDSSGEDSNNRDNEVCDSHDDDDNDNIPSPRLIISPAQTASLTSMSTGRASTVRDRRDITQ
jgi:hypothetical protein